MSPAPLPIRSFDLATATERDYRAVNAFTNRIQSELLPDDPPITLEETMQNYRDLAAFAKVYEWHIWQEDERTLAATAWLALPGNDNPPVGLFNIDVAAEQRRQGLARRLLAQVAECAINTERRLLMVNTNARIPAGVHFLERLGAQKGFTGHTDQLALTDLNRALLRQWQRNALPLANAFTLGLWTEAYPEDALAAIANLTMLAHNRLSPEQWAASPGPLTPKLLRAVERALLAERTERWTLYLRERAGNQLVGYTEVFWNANRPDLLLQGATAILPAYRCRGLGRWLKAAMIDKVRWDRPTVQFIRTNGADANATMRKINQALGFKPYLVNTGWQIETTQVTAYLRNNTIRPDLTFTRCHRPCAYCCD